MGQYKEFYTKSTLKFIKMVKYLQTLLKTTISTENSIDHF